MDASCFCCQFSLNTAGIIIGVFEIVQYTVNINERKINWTICSKLFFSSSIARISCSSFLHSISSKVSWKVFPSSSDLNFSLHSFRWLRLSHNCYLLFMCTHHYFSAPCIRIFQSKYKFLTSTSRRCFSVFYRTAIRIVLAIT